MPVGMFPCSDLVPLNEPMWPMPGCSANSSPEGESESQQELSQRSKFKQQWQLFLRWKSRPSRSGVIWVSSAEMIKVWLKSELNSHFENFSSACQSNMGGRNLGTTFCLWLLGVCATLFLFLCSWFIPQSSNVSFLLITVELVLRSVFTLGLSWRDVCDKCCIGVLFLLT